MSQDDFFEKPISCDGPTVSVLVPYPVDKAYDYAVPAGVNVREGDYVCVPLGNREIAGVVWGQGAGDVDRTKIKPIISKYNLDPMPAQHRKFIDWVANYTLSMKGSVLKMALSAPAGLHPPKPTTGYQLGAPSDKGITPQRQKVLDVMREGQILGASEITQMAGCSAAVVKGMAEKGLLEAVGRFTPAPCLNPNYDSGRAHLSAAQQESADAICDEDQYGVFLLDGVTGAGKTEVYFEAVAKALERGKQALILLPEIALSNAFLTRFQDRFGCAPALWHSHLTPAQRRNTWRGVASGDTRVVVGARSALFLPYKELGFIVVDEEHDPAYKQEDGVIYHARDMAIVRAHIGDFPICLASATPSLETMMNTWDGKYEHLILPARYGGAALPDIDVIDLRTDKPERQCFLSSKLIEATREKVERGEQVLLFLNRRGYAPLTLCRTCGHRMECPRCTAWLVEHKRSSKLHCHHCGYNLPVPKHCPECDDSDSFAACGPGVERIMEEVKTHFPEARTTIIASDTAESPEELKELLQTVKDGEVDIIIGTQIIAKGHHFPNLTLVGVVDADLGLTGGELRAAERTYQMLHQVAGRAGRAEKKGSVLLQSYMPEHRIMQAMAGEGRDAFLDIEAQEREIAKMPPYSRLVGIIVAGRDHNQVIEIAKTLGKTAPQSAEIQTLGPAPAPMARLRGRHRYRLLVRAEKSINVQKTVAGWVNAIKVPSTVRVYIDIDPQSFL